MATKKTVLNEKTTEGYDILHPETDINYVLDVPSGKTAKELIDESQVYSKHETFISTEGQTVFILQNGTYVTNDDRLEVIVGGVHQYSPDNFVETDSDRITFNDPLPLGLEVIINYFSGSAAITMDLENEINDVKVRVTTNENNLVLTSDKINNFTNDFEYKTPQINGSQLSITNTSDSNRVFLRLEENVTGNISLSEDDGISYRNVVDINGTQLTSLEKGFHELVLVGNFFILRNKGGLSDSDLQALITITNEIENNQNVLKNNYVTALKSVDSSLNISNDSTWNQILNELPNIKSSSINYAIGNVTPSSSRHTITGLSFRPSYFITYYNNAYYSLYVDLSNIGMYDNILNITRKDSIFDSDNQINNDGFTFSSQANLNYKWIAFSQI